MDFGDFYPGYQRGCWVTQGLVKGPSESKWWGFKLSKALWARGVPEIMGPRTPALGPIILGTFRACGVNPTLKLTREQYTRNMAAWGVALLLFLLGYYHPIRQRRRWWRLPLQLQFSTLPFAPGNLDEPAREAVETDKRTKKQTTLFTICAKRLRKSRVVMEPGGRNSRRMKHQGKKANVTQGESDPFDAMPPVAWSKFPRLIGRAGRNKKAAREGTSTHGALHRYQCCCLIIPAAVSSIKLAHEVSERASDDG